MRHRSVGRVDGLPFHNITSLSSEGYPPAENRAGRAAGAAGASGLWVGTAKGVVFRAAPVPTAAVTAAEEGGAVGAAGAAGAFVPPQDRYLYGPRYHPGERATHVSCVALLCGCDGMKPTPARPSERPRARTNRPNRATDRPTDRLTDQPTN